MEKRRLEVGKDSIGYIKEIYSIFMWNLVSEKPINDQKIELNYERDDSIPHIQGLRVIEEEFQPKILPIFVTFIPTILALITMTIALIIFILSKELLSPKILILAFMIPSSFLLLIGVGLNYLRSKQYRKYYIDNASTIQDAKDRVNKLLKK